jgi:hypothetical protein
VVYCRGGYVRYSELEVVNSTGLRDAEYNIDTQNYGTCASPCWHAKVTRGYIYDYMTPSRKQQSSLSIVHFSHILQSCVVTSMIRRHLPNDLFDQSDQLINVWPFRRLDLQTPPYNFLDRL